MAGIEKSPNLMQTVADLEFPGGPIPLDSPFYIDRSPAEARACAEIGKPGSLICIKAPRKMGKSSLMLRIIDAAVDRGYRTVTVDFQQADAAVFATLDKFLRWLCVNVARQLKLEPNLDEFWDEDMGSKVSCSLYFENYLLEQIDSPLVLVLNEVNRVFERAKIAQEFLPLLRFWYEQARQSETWEKLRIVVIHSTEIYIALSLNQSPFNVGLPIKLSEFTAEQVRDLARRHGLDWTLGYGLWAMGIGYWALGYPHFFENRYNLSGELYRLYFQEQNLCKDSFSAVVFEELQQENERLLALVNVDELTQIGNRRHFDSCLRAEWKHMTRDGSPISLILCDIDYFKIYNDTYGHQAGDSCLRSVAQAIRRSLDRPADVASRYGGEEFAVILPQTDAAGALLVAEHIRTKVKALNIVFNPESVECLPNSVVTISLGIASVVPGPENDAATLVLAADEALYDSKRHGRDRLTMSTLLNFRFAAVN